MASVESWPKIREPALRSSIPGYAPPHRPPGIVSLFSGIVRFLVVRPNESCVLSLKLILPPAKLFSPTTKIFVDNTKSFVVECPA